VERLEGEEKTKEGERGGGGKERTVTSKTLGWILGNRREIKSRSAGNRGLRKLTEQPGHRGT